MRVPKTRSAVATSILAMALALLPVSDVWSYSVCADSYAGGCLASTICHHYDDYGNWTGSVYIEYQC